jgi:hypothetical protein
MKTKFWAPRPEVLAYVAGLIKDGAKVLEIGPGAIPFSKATHFVDRFPGIDLPNYFVADVAHDPLPFTPKEFDFVYCRHVVEDLSDPYNLLKEMSRVGKAGYVETPSPLCELTADVDGMVDSYWRGYIHHRSVVWAQEGVLHYVQKNPIIEHVDFDGSAILESEPFAWNTYLLWEHELKFKPIEHDIDFRLQLNYGDVLKFAAMQADEAEFVRTLPTGQWLLCKQEPPKNQSAQLHGFEVRSPFAVVVAVGPDFRQDVRTGDRVTYAECLNLPKELLASAATAWARAYIWVHENKFLGRQPRNTEEKALEATGQIEDGTPPAWALKFAEKVAQARIERGEK